MNITTSLLFERLLNHLEKDLEIAKRIKDRVSNIAWLAHATSIEQELIMSNAVTNEWLNTLNSVYWLYYKHEFDKARELMKELYLTDGEDDLQYRVKNYVNKFSRFMEWRYLDNMIENYNKGIDDISANEYQEKALRTAGNPNIENGLMGLCGEAGECIDILKKSMFQGHELDREHLAEELGDVAWYLAISASALGYNLSDILKSNVEKLRKRYPRGFEAEKSVNRQGSSIRGIIDIDEMYGKK